MLGGDEEECSGDEGGCGCRALRRFEVRVAVVVVLVVVLLLDFLLDLVFFDDFVFDLAVVVGVVFFRLVSSHKLFLLLGVVVSKGRISLQPSSFNKRLAASKTMC